MTDNEMKLDEKNYISIAERVVRKLCEKKDKKDNPMIFSTSQIRNLLIMISEIYSEVINDKSEKLSDDMIGRINCLKVRFLYEAGREPNVKRLVKEAGILEHLNEIKDSKKQYILFKRYMEALVALRKYYVAYDE